MNNDSNSTSNEAGPDGAADASRAPGAARTLLVAGLADTSSLWRVVSTDGSSRVFQTRPALDNRRRLPLKPSAGDTAQNVPVKQAATPAGPALFERRSSNLPTLVAEEAPAVATPDATLATELTSVTQAWPTLSPGIRGAVMALIRAATNPRRGGPTPSPRRV